MNDPFKLSGHINCVCRCFFFAGVKIRNSSAEEFFTSKLMRHFQKQDKRKQSNFSPEIFLRGLSAEYNDIKLSESVFRFSFRKVIEKKDAAKKLR